MGDGDIQVKHVQFRAGKAGALVRGTAAIELDDFDTSLHMERAVWLTCQLEGPRWGMVQSYDGAAMSGGLLHNIAVAPKGMTQGDLFALLRHIEIARPGSSALKALFDAFRTEGWFVAGDGALRDYQTGRLVRAQDIRATFTPPNGNVPKRGEHWVQARRWAILFHRVFAESATHHPQISFAATWLANTHKRLELDVYQKLLDRSLDSPIALRAGALPHDHELALCVYHAFSVNGPTPAAKALRAAAERAGGPRAEDFPAQLVRRLATSAYGAWRERRYPATRRAVLEGVRQGLWVRMPEWMPARF